MQYFGVPRCPYCRKRVNLIRTWSLKRQGEYRCPRCGGISNIFLSPLIYVFALLAVFAGGAVYFFHRFILDDVDLFTCFQVILPFAVFFLLSLFLVYLAKPVIKRVPREEATRKGRKAAAGRRPAPAGQTFVDSGEYLPPADYRTGPFPQESSASRPAAAHTTVLPPVEPSRQVRQQQPQRPRPVSGAAAQPRPARAPQRPAPSSPAVSGGAPAGTSHGPAAQRPAGQPRPAGSAPARQGTRPAAPRRPAPSAQGAPSRPAPRQAAAAPAQQPVSRPETPGTAAERPVSQETQVIAPRPQRPAAASHAGSTAEPRRASHVVRSVELPGANDDFFAKYDDPAYVERRLKELKEERERNQSNGR